MTEHGKILKMIKYIIDKFEQLESSPVSIEFGDVYCQQFKIVFVVDENIEKFLNSEEFEKVSQTIFDKFNLNDLTYCDYNIKKTNGPKKIYNGNLFEMNIN